MDSDTQDKMREELADVSEKDLLLEIMTELKTIRFGLQTGEFGEIEHEQSEPDQYTCSLCGATVTAEERNTHAQNKHGYPEMLDATDEFEKQ